MTVCDDLYAGTGFSEEMKSVLFRLADEYEIYWVSLQHTGYPEIVYDNEFPDLPPKGNHITQLAGMGLGQNAGFESFKRHFHHYKPDILWNIGDPNHFLDYVKYKKIEPFTFIGYTTLDGLPLYPPWKELFNYIDVPVCMTEWANREFLQAGYKMAARLHHGVNWNWWATNAERKQKLKEHYGLGDYVLFGNWESNQFRKRPSALLKAWKAAHPERKKMKLVMLTDTNCRMGNNLYSLIEQYDVPRETVIFPEDLSPIGEKKYFDQAMPMEEHKRLCELIDVYVSTTGGEGFGKGPLEGMSLNIPVIIGEHSACQEVCARGSILVPVVGYYRPRDAVKVVDLALVDEEKFTEAILQLYYHPEEREELGIEARSWAKEFDYDTQITPSWKDLLSRVNPDVFLANDLLKYG